ncbi:MAG: T9SS type A sorting domain-containing protein [bacterium]
MFYHTHYPKNFSAKKVTRPFLRSILFFCLLISLSGQSAPAGEKDLDLSTRINANLIDMVLTNYGSFAWDVMYGAPGLVYPNGTDRTAVYAAGLWMGARVDGELRVSVAEYSTTYMPGPILSPGEWADPWDERYRTYKITRGEWNPDYAEWPVEDGAPVGEDGYPRVIGEQMLWSLYNDLDPSYRTNHAATALPLEIEVRQTTFADYQYGAAERTVFLEWKILNKGLDLLTDAYVSVWMDPDLGGSWDDLVGCDTLLSLGYCYNATNDDEIYGSTPPAVGVVILQGPIVPAPGDSACVASSVIPDYINLPMTAFNKYINGTDPENPDQTYNYMQGLDQDGSVLIDPTTNLPTKYSVPGDPVSGEGWIDENPSDRRMLLTSGPFQMAPGDSQIVAVAVVIGQGPDRLSSIVNLKEHAGEAPGLYRDLVEAPQPPPIPPLPALSWEWSPDPRWLTGVDWGGSAFLGGIGFGREFFGSTLADSEYVEVLIRFDSTEITTCAVYDRNQSYEWAGTGTFPGSAYDISDPGNPRRLNICFTEFDRLDGIWEPDTSALGAREYLFIMDGDYNEGADYDDENWGPDADVQYGAWLRVRDPYIFFETDPAELTLTFPTATVDDGLEPESSPITDLNLQGFTTYPNPACNRMAVAFDLSQASPVRISILDVSGRLVDEPISGRLFPPGSHQLNWSRPRGSKELASGVYFCRIQAGREVQSHRVIMLR